jgi:hypothetical protein
LLGLSTNSTISIGSVTKAYYYRAEKIRVPISTNTRWPIPKLSSTIVCSNSVVPVSAPSAEVDNLLLLSEHYVNV